MSNRSSRLPYNERAFSPQRMMSSSNYSSSNMNQIGSLDSSSRDRYQQAFFQLQNELNRDNMSSSQRNQNDFDNGWYRNENQNVGGGRDRFDSINNQNFSNSAFNSQQSNFSGNLPSINSAQNRMSFNPDSILQSSNFSQDRRLDSNYRSSDTQRLDYGSIMQQLSNYGSLSQQRSDLGLSSQQRSNVGSSSRSYSSVWENGQNTLNERLPSREDKSRDDRNRDDRGRGSRTRDVRIRDDRIREDRIREDRIREDRIRDERNRNDKIREDKNRDDRIREDRRRDQDTKTSSTPSRSAPSAPRYNSDSSKQNPRTSRPEPSSTADKKVRGEKYPDIGEPKIKPKFADMISVVRKDDNGTVIYKCNICKIDCLPDPNLKPHLAGKKHKYFLKVFEDSLPGKTKFQKEKHMREVVNEKHFDHKPMFEMIISSITQPLVALEYIVEVLDSKAKEQLYLCILCDKRCDPRTIEKHLVSQTHRINYLAKHFTPIHAQLQASRRFTEDLEFRQKVLMMITSRIEVKFGRTSAFVYEGNDFSETKLDIIESINLKKHVTINDIPNDAFLLDGIKLKDFKWESENEPKPPKEPLEVPAGVKRKRKVPEDVLEDYRSAVEYAKSSMEDRLREYERDPDSHPKYKIEWELFWNNKIDEMSRRGEDSSNHNFHDEWCGFFVKRMRELHEEELKWKVDQIRRNLGLSKEDVGETPDDPDPKRSRRGRFNDDQDDEGSLDEDFREFSRRVPKDVLYTKEKKIFNKFLHEVGIDQNKRPKPQPILVERREPVDRTIPEKSPPRSNEPTTLITTCRLLTSLEPELGLLAQKVLDLLSKSIAFEREHSKSSNELLFENENLILIETVKEKIIGMQMAHLITQNRTKAVEKAVSEITKLIGQHEVMSNIKKTLREMGKDDASQEEIEMLKAMFMMKKDDKGSGDKVEDKTEHLGRRQRRRAKKNQMEEANAKK